MPVAAVMLALCTLTPAPLCAQLPGVAPLAPELRADVIVGHQPAVQVGAGVQIPAGYYMRIGLVAAAGARVGGTDSFTTSRLDGRLDVLARFLLDPFRQSAYGLSLGGGVSLRAEPNDRVRPLLLVAVDLEGRRSAAGWVPALQVGLGGGVRIGVALRHGVAGAR